MKKLLLTGLVAVSTVCSYAGITPEQVEAIKEIQKSFSQSVAILKQEKKEIFNNISANSQQFDTEINEIIYRVGFGFINVVAYINAVLNNKKSLSREDIFFGLMQLYSSAIALNAQESKSEDIWMRPEAYEIFEVFSAELPKDSYNFLELIIVSEYYASIKNAGLKEENNNFSPDEITQDQDEAAISEVVVVTVSELYSRLVLAVAKNAGRTEITKQDKEAGLAIFVDFFESCVKHVSFEESQQPVAETKTVESKKTTNNKTGTGTKKTPKRPVHKKK